MSEEHVIAYVTSRFTPCGNTKKANLVSLYYCYCIWYYLNQLKGTGVNR